jgi:dihydroorotate dehydrogenase electron transfer subunit
MDTPLMLPIVQITDENPHVKTFWFEYDLQSQPGQFVFVWLPGVDQKPFSIAYDSGNRFGLTIFAVGPMTKKLFTMRPGDRVGITGPYGSSFSIKENMHYITVAGGYGAGPLGLFTERLGVTRATVDFCVGARTQDLLLFEERVARLPYVNVHVSTDDGSKGHHGYVTHILEEQLKKRAMLDALRSTLVLTCGPELMEKAALDICNTYDVNCEISIERYMKCGFNICGQCCMDPLGIPMCSIGPVVNRDIANKLTEFGSYHRDKSGIKQAYI